MENKLQIDDNNFITYKIFDNNSKADYDLMYLHGFYGDMDGSKGTLFENIAKENNLNLIKLSYLGHGNSSGKVVDYTLSDWASNIETIINKFSNKKLLLIGSSMGGWLSYITALKYKEKIKGVFTLATAIDFLTEVIEPKSDLTKDMAHEIINSDGSHSGNFITTKLILDSKKYNLFDKEELSFDFPVKMIHGLKDDLISYEIALKFINKINCKNAELILLKNADHRFSLENNLNILKREVVNFIKGI